MRSKRIEIRVSEAEHADAHRVAERRGLTLSEWIREVVRSAIGRKAK